MFSSDFGQKEDLVVTLLSAGHCPGSVMQVTAFQSIGVFVLVLRTLLPNPIFL